MILQTGKDIQPYFVIGLGLEVIDNEINSKESESTDHRILTTSDEVGSVRWFRFKGDLIIGNFEDTYENLPLKTMLGYQFAVHHCQNVDLFFYQDDDIFMRFDEFLHYNIDVRKDRNVNNPFMICPMSGPAPADPTERVNYFMKHWSPINLYPPSSKIIPYCNGPCTFLTASGKDICHATECIHGSLNIDF